MSGCSTALPRAAASPRRDRSSCPRPTRCCPLPAGRGHGARPAAKVIEADGGLDILVNNVGIEGRRPW